MMTKNIGVFIPGRLGSERCPNKLIRSLGDKNLWQIACEKLQYINQYYNTYTLVYDQELINISKNHDITTIVRAEETAKADSPSSFVFKDIEQMDCEYLMLLNPCFAFLSAETILYCIDLFNCSSADYATSVKLFQSYIFDDSNNPVTNIDYTDINTKSVTGYYEMAHCFHIFKKDEFLDTGLMLQPNHDTYEVPESETIDIDTEDDFQYVKWLYEICGRR